MAGAWLYLCSQYFFSYLLIAPLENYAPPIKIENIQPHENSGIFVLACFYYDAPDKPLVSQWNDCSLRRLLQVALMYKAQPQTIMLTGGTFNPYSEAVYADAAKAFLITLGVPEADIVPISAEGGTHQEVNMLAQHEIKFDHYFVVSSATHSYRLTHLMQQAKFSNFTLIPVDQYNVNDFHFEPALPSLSHLQRSRAAFYEYAAIVAMYLDSIK